MRKLNMQLRKQRKLMKKLRLPMKQPKLSLPLTGRVKLILKKKPILKPEGLKNMVLNKMLMLLLK